MTVHDSDLLEPSPFLISDVIHEQIADVIYDQISDVIYDQIPDVIQEQIADAIYDQIPDVIHEQIPGILQEDIADVIYDQIPDVIHEQITDVLYDQIADALADKGYCLLTDLLPSEITQSLYQRAVSSGGIPAVLSQPVLQLVREHNRPYLSESQARRQNKLPLHQQLLLQPLASGRLRRA